ALLRVQMYRLVAADRFELAAADLVERVRLRIESGRLEQGLPSHLALGHLDCAVVHEDLERLQARFVSHLAFLLGRPPSGRGGLRRYVVMLLRIVADGVAAGFTLHLAIEEGRGMQCAI